MKILDIEASSEKLMLHTDSNCRVTVRESVPTVGEKPGRTLAVLCAKAESGTIQLPRYEGGRDRIFSCYDVFCEGEPVCALHTSQRPSLFPSTWFPVAGIVCVVISL